ncbi:MAG TPA: SH3 domain-containing protein, partial [Candidatus Limnocylindrales bacterium]|nr:SH3 domain-containing protein [Candidatus Limnocylindrales bacterium]
QTVMPAPGATIALATVALTTPGANQITVSSGNGQVGQFVISLQGGAPLPPAVPLVLGQLQAGAVTAQTPIILFTFTALPTDNAIVIMRAEGPSGVPIASGPLMQLRDQETNEALASISPRLIGTSLRVPQGTVSYVLQVAHSGGNQTETFTVCLESELGNIRCPGSQAALPPTSAVNPPTFTPIPPTRIPAVVIPPGAPCSVASSVGTPVNIRSGPSTNFPIVTQLPPTTTAAVLARLPDSSWYQVSVNGILGWVSGSVVVIGGQCGAVPAVTLTPTMPSATVIPPVSSTPIPIVTLPAVLTVTPVPTLNFSLPSNYGSVTLTSGFVPDPSTVNVTSGGTVDLSYLGSGCTGFATSAPDFSVNYTSGAFPTLRFFFVGSGDTTMVINTPGGNFVCADDSFGTLNPSLDFNSPASGRYDVWIGSFSSGAFVSGTLNVTENMGNHP